MNLIKKWLSELKKEIKEMFIAVINEDIDKELQKEYAACGKQIFETECLYPSTRDDAAIIYKEWSKGVISECGLHDDLLREYARYTADKKIFHEWAYSKNRELDCSCYHSEYETPRCWGTKNSEECSCNGSKKNCNFYAYDDNGKYLGLK